MAFHFADLHWTITNDFTDPLCDIKVGDPQLPIEIGQVMPRRIENKSWHSYTACNYDVINVDRILITHALKPVCTYFMLLKKVLLRGVET